MIALQLARLLAFCWLACATGQLALSAAPATAPAPDQLRQSAAALVQRLPTDRAAAREATKLLPELRRAKLLPEALELATAAANAAADPALAAELNDQRSQILVELGRVDEALAAMRAILAADPFSNWRATRWASALRSAKRPAEADAIAFDAIAAAPSVTINVYRLQRLRVQALLDMNKPHEAAAAAKGLFNVAPMELSREAMLLVGRCLKAAEPEGNVEQRFLMQQMLGAAEDGSGASAQTLMHGIRVDPGPYEVPLANASLRSGVQGLVGQGNLELLADRPAAARKLFEQAYPMIADAAEAAEHIARCIKAEDGCLGRAMAFAKSIRPPLP